MPSNPWPALNMSFFPFVLASETANPKFVNELCNDQQTDFQVLRMRNHKNMQFESQKSTGIIPHTTILTFGSLHNFSKPSPVAVFTAAEKLSIINTLTTRESIAIQRANMQSNNEQSAREKVEIHGAFDKILVCEEGSIFRVISEAQGII
jgi:hypothetical protein